ncbi:MAG: hypothetical protein F4Y31_00960 [Gammaproteobacteria bacterium]|nr:hypothetical protein [Gammaproteobacteria bacterium]
MSLRQLVMRKGLPFDARIPNAETIDALAEPAERMKRFRSTRAVFSHLETASDADQEDR